MLIALSSRKQYHVRKRKKIFCVILRAYLKMLTSPNISLQEANWIFAAEKIWICSVSLTNFPLQMKICSKLIYRCKGFKEDCSLFSWIWSSGKCKRVAVRIIHSYPRIESQSIPHPILTIQYDPLQVGCRYRKQVYCPSNENTKSFQQWSHGAIPSNPIMIDYNR